LVKESWFPNWEAEGASGPYRATPNSIVVVPTRHDVTLRYGTTTAEWLGRLGTLAGIGGVVLLAWWPARRRRRAVEVESTAASDAESV
jgi:cyanate permease